MSEKAPSEETRPAVVEEREFSQPPERVWDALTDPEKMSRWLLPAPDFAPEPGRRFHLHGPGGERIGGEVREADAPHRLVYTWDGGNTDATPTHVTWTLTPTERGGTHVRIEHTARLRASAGGRARSFIRYAVPRADRYTVGYSHRSARSTQRRNDYEPGTHGRRAGCAWRARL
jgi:uncharacterized protein YndB with AHSA1/START domain